jgi:hypothetical protein
MERKLTAILSADVKGYSRLMGADEEGTLRTLTVSFWEGGSPHLQVTPLGGLRYDGGHAPVPSSRPHCL